MTHPPRPHATPRARVIHAPTSKAALHLEAAVDVLAWPISGDKIGGQRLGRNAEGQLWQRLAEREVATYGEGSRCPACNGWGVVSVMQHDGNEDTYQCLDCGGSGEGPLSIGDVSLRGPLVARMEEAQARRILEREIEARRPAMRAAALHHLALDGLPLYALALDGSGRVGLMRPVVADALAQAAERRA